MHCRSVALTQHAAKLAGFYPEALAVDEIVDTINELTSKIPTSKDPEEYMKLRAEYQETTMKQYSDFIESVIQQNGGMLVTGKSVAMADIALTRMVEPIEPRSRDHIDSKTVEHKKLRNVASAPKARVKNEKYTRKFYRFESASKIHTGSMYCRVQAVRRAGRSQLSRGHNHQLRVIVS
jgi:hypothetical protein